VDARLDAGEITASGPDWGPITGRPEESTGYRIALPANAIKAGTFTVHASGGKDIGAFETSVTIPPPIQPNAYPPGFRIPAYQLLGGRPRFEWSGGDDRSWVRVGVLSRPVKAGRGDWLKEHDAPAQNGSLRMITLDFFGLVPAAEAELTFTQDAVAPVTFEAPGLTKGGLHRWVYRWRFKGVVVVGDDVR
jgi:hypothetical protein